MELGYTINNIYKRPSVSKFMDFDFSEMKGKNVLITGGLGFLGSTLSQKLVNLGANVTIFSRPGKDRKNVKEIESSLKFIEGDLKNVEDIKKSIINQDYLFHFSWQNDLKKSMKNPIEDVQNDVIGSLNILESCKEKNPNIKIIFSSTVTVVGLPKKTQSNEEEYEEPLSVYEANKLIVEKYLKIYNKIYGIRTCSLRISNVFGELQRIDNLNRGVLNFMIGKALRGEKLTVYGEGNFIRDYNYVENYIDAFLLAALSKKTDGNFYVLGSGQGKTFNEVVEKIKNIVESLTKKKVDITHIPNPQGENEINKRNFIADYSKFKRDTGWFPKISFDEGLKKTIEFFVKV
tara:strand:+ start:37924 stop:38964 length:1041 start_codon:yes stop_codon:yes gene_type:complete